MLRRATLTFLAVLAAAAVVAPAVSAKSDLWSGNWLVGSRDENGARTKFGIIHLELADDNTTITGTYSFSGGGTLRAELNHEFGPTMTGTYKDKTGKGRFSATLQSDTTDFLGWYKPCRVFCRSHPWWGQRQ